MKKIININDKIVIYALISLQIGIWSIPHTNAARYIITLVLLTVLIFFVKNIKLKTDFIFKSLFIYLLINIIISESWKNALYNFKSEWLHFLIYSILGILFGEWLKHNKSRYTLLHLGFCFSIPALIHVVILVKILIQDGVNPYGELGINNSHGELGYSALCAVTLIGCYLFFEAKKRFEIRISLFLIILVFISLFYAKGRGDLFFCSLSLILIISMLTPNYKYKLLLFIATFFIAVIILNRFSTDLQKFERATISIHADSIEVICGGAGELEKRKIIEYGGVLPWGVRDALQNINNYDAARILALKSGIYLVIQNPWGFDQSKHGYQIGMKNACKGEPNLKLSNAHNGWLDTALSIGLLGSMLLFFLYIKYAYIGFAIRNNAHGIYGFGRALFLLSTLWILRGMLDATLMDQMLEIQAFILCLFYTLCHEKR